MTGNQTYNISAQSFPKVTQAIFSPIDPEQNSTQNVTLTVSAVVSDPVTSVTANVLLDDNTFVPVSFSLDSGTNVEGTWKGSWIMPADATYCVVYGIDLMAASSSVSSPVPVELRFR